MRRSRVGNSGESEATRRTTHHAVAREALFLGLSAAGAWVFINHELLYLEGPFRLSTAPLGAYSLATAVIYVFIRGALLIAKLAESRATTPPLNSKRTPSRTPLVVPLARPRPRTSSPQRPPVPPPIALRRAVFSAKSIAPAPSQAGAALAELENPIDPGTRVLKEPWRPSWMTAEPRQR